MSSDWGKIFGSFKNWYIHCNIIIYEHRLSNKDKQDELWANAHLFLLNILWVVFQLYSGSIIYKNGEGMGQPGQWL
jgi:hypothetical protein